MFEKFKPYLASKPLIVIIPISVLLLILGLGSYLFISSKSSHASKETSVTPSSSSPTESSNSTVLDPTLHSETLTLLSSQPSNLIDVNKAATFNTISVFLDGSPVKIDARPFSFETRVYLPLRQVGESLNVQIGWNKDYSTAIVETPQIRLELPVGYRKAVRIYKDSPESAELLSIDLTSTKVGTILYNDITYLPIRFTAEALGFHVKFDDGNAKVLFTSPIQ